MKFKSDEQRKAVFANLNLGSSKQTKVGSSNVKNMEISISKRKAGKTKVNSKSLQQNQNFPINRHIKIVSLNYSTHLEDIKTKSTKEFCNACKRKGLSLKRGRCKDCIKEMKRYKPTILKDILELSPLLKDIANSYDDIQLSTLSDYQMWEIVSEADLEDVNEDDLYEAIEFVLSNAERGRELREIIKEIEASDTKLKLEHNLQQFFDVFSVPSDDEMAGRILERFKRWDSDEHKKLTKLIKKMEMRLI